MIRHPLRGAAVWSHAPTDSYFESVGEMCAEHMASRQSFAQTRASARPARPQVNDPWGIQILTSRCCWLVLGNLGMARYPDGVLDGIVTMGPDKWSPRTNAGSARRAPSMQVFDADGNTIWNAP